MYLDLIWDVYEYILKSILAIEIQLCVNNLVKVGKSKCIEQFGN